MYAHAFTADGAPARDLSDAPDWCVEVTPEDDARLLAALFEAGPGRYARLGPPPPPPKGAPKAAEPLGWASMFAAFERAQAAPPASFYDRDLPQTLTWARAAAERYPEEGR